MNLKSCMLAAGVIGLLQITVAQTVHPMDLSQKGKGILHFNGHNYAISSIHVTMAQGGSATINARISGPDVTLSGNSSSTSDRTNVGLNLNDLTFGNEHDKISVSGQMVLDKDGDVRSVMLTGKNNADNNKVSMTFHSSDTDHKGNGSTGDQTARTAAGRYTDHENWTRNGQTFALLYTLDLARNSGQAIMTVAPQTDRNEPNDKNDRAAHGDVLDYLHTGQTVRQIGHWWQKGNTISITFTEIQYGKTSRAKSERLSGHLKGTTIFIDAWDRSFFGHDAKLSFEKS
jgi:hypothetical protein